jgi:hypothetical protein
MALCSGCYMVLESDDSGVISALAFDKTMLYKKGNYL